ncbi:GGDEF domain-containing protein [Maridesulfovibrio sp.]|uniref:GGDEF domain-containing protein n=1 Tax=Maridesulfovibrio sp. TaxID=2795000 RepID=UPI002A18D940|nr:GGDEF domain-containing protein [Maridesulfovibrio sp.]
MRFQDAARLRYKITIPIILVLTLAALYLFHTILIERKNLLDTQNLLSGLRTTAVEILTAPAETTHESTLKIFKSILEELQSYPADIRLANLLDNEDSKLFFSAENFLKAAASGNSKALTVAMRELDSSIGMVTVDINKISDNFHVNMVKYEYGILFLICILAALHHFLVDSPMREELIRCAREKEVSKSTIKKLAERDTLTNLPGRMKFYEEAEKAVSTATRYGSDLALIKMDIHDFKTINQIHGQKVGDKILAGFARVVRKNLRRPDSFFRVGGDKFIILAPHTNVTNAKNLTEKINKLISTAKILKPVPFMMNTGIAMCGHEDSGESLLKKVDLALNESKKYGPGTVYTHPESAKPTE